MKLSGFLGLLLTGWVLAACSYGTALEADSSTSLTASDVAAASTAGTAKSPSTTIPISVSSTTPTHDDQPHPACRPDPFASDVADKLAVEYPGKLITAHVYDTRTGCHYSLNPDSRQSTASVFKVLVMAGTLLEAQGDDRQVTVWEISQLAPMINDSANDPVRALWRSFGASPWFREQGRVFGLEETLIDSDGGSAWGATRTSASDQVKLLRQVLLGEWGPLDGPSRQTALELMTSVVPEQTWGITAGVPHTWIVAQKNGFAGSTINSVGWVDEPGESPGYLVAILTRGWANHPSGIDAVERINLLVVSSMIDNTPNSE